MKHILKGSFSSLLLLLLVCTHAQEVAKRKASTASETVINNSTRNSGNNTMQGAYAMLMQIMNDGNRDSMLNVQQFKIYTDRHFMYAHALPGDSVAYYGIGTYRMENGKLLEYPFYTSTNGAQEDTFDIKITKLGNGFVQVINFPPDSLGRKSVLTEEYGDVSNAVSSPLDGAWKQTKNEFIPKQGTPVTNTNPTQYKLFQSGRFIWASTAPDSVTKEPVSAFGYGTFEMNGSNKFRERTTNSTFRTALIGKPVMVQLKFMGTDAYQQTIDWPTGKSIETYQRLK
jgi:hypothetical protein